MLNLYLTITGLMLTSRNRLTDRLQQAPANDDAGVITLEMVIIALGLFLVAGVAVGVIVAAINGRLTQIS